jgi:hypothetical protein
MMAGGTHGFDGAALSPNTYASVPLPGEGFYPVLPNQRPWAVTAGGC